MSQDYSHRLLDPSKTKKFQALSHAYSILCNKELRETYDATGLVDDSSTLVDGSESWYDFWRTVFPRVTVERIDKLKAEYQNSKEERNHIKKYYESSKGNMDFIMDNLMFSTCEDEPRVVEIIQKMIEEKSVESYSSFTNESKGKKKRRIDKAKKEASEVQSSMNDLASVIAARQAVRSENLVESLEKKYCKPKRGKKR